ncbi:MAM and fibronectin type III domain-containing protein 1-like [Oculina patagonica]
MASMFMTNLCGFCVILCWLYLPVISPVAANPTEGDVRLVDGGVNSQGRIEIYYNDTWWTLCQNHFNHDAFNTVCRMLSLPEPEEQFHESQFGPGNQSILPMDFSCDGHESTLMECRHEDYYDHHCGDQNTVGIACGELVMEACDGGGDRTNISGQLHFLRGRKPNERDCEWTIGDSGSPAGDRVIVNTYYNSEDCGTHVSIKDPSSDHEFFRESLCGHWRFGIVEIETSQVVVRVEQHNEDEDVPFDGAYVIVNGDMDSASQVSGWDLSTINITKESLYIQWSKLTSEIAQPVRVYILVAIPEDEHWKRTGRIVSSDTSSAGIYGLSPFRDYKVTVFAVDDSGQLHKSSEMTVVTDEDVPTSSPHYHGYMIDEAGCLQVTWNQISEHERNGHIIGYIITYVAECFDGQENGHEGNVTVSGMSNNVTFCELRSGLKYRIGIAGFTSKGMGPFGHHGVFASCGGERILTKINGTIQSPNKPCRYGGEQQCMWSIRPNASTPKAIWMRFTEFRLSHHHDDSKSCRSYDWVGISTV